MVTARDLAKRYREDIKADVGSRWAKPYLKTFLAAQNPAAEAYINATRLACRDVGIRFENERITDISRLQAAVLRANRDPEVHGIMVYYPLSDPSFERIIRNSISPAKDVEGLSDFHLRAVYDKSCWLRSVATGHDAGGHVVPCTPMAILKILESTGAYNYALPPSERLRNKTITIINRSEIVGRPLAAMLAHDGATVFAVNVDDIKIIGGVPSARHAKIDDVLTVAGLEDILPVSDIVITGVPRSNFKLPAAYLKKGATVVNFAASRNFNMDITQRARLVVSNIGPLTVTMLQRNLLWLARNLSPPILPQTTPHARANFF